MPDADKTRDRPLFYAIALLLLPVLVLWRHDDPLYTPLWQSDPWFYLGYFHNLVNFKRDLFPGFYYGSRLSWILPGYVIHRLLSPVAANAILHLGVHSIAVLALFSTLRRTIGLRSAYLTAMIFALHPWFWAATGWDHVNGGVLAYYLLAMALLTRAAAGPDRKWPLIAAGMAIAGAVHAHLFVTALMPLLAVHYLALVWAWRSSPVRRSLQRLCLWAGIGFVVFTAPICAINGLLVDGNPWFWTPSLHTAQAVTANYIWSESLWFEHRLAPYLWMIAAALTAAILLLPFQWKQATRVKKVAALLFSAQLLIGGALMIYLQSRGITLLGHYYYACYLFPFVFPVLGVSFFPAVKNLSQRAWALTCSIATLVFGLAWVEPAANPVLVRLIPEWCAFLVAGCILLTALVLRARASGAWLALAGLAILTSLTYNGSYRWVDIHGTRQEYVRIMDARRHIEEERSNRPIRFWYDKSEPAFFEYYALNAGYLAEFARIGESFPKECQGTVELGSLVVVTSAKEHTPEAAKGALADCWQGSGIAPAIQSTWQMARPGQPYMLVVLKAVEDLSLLQPLRLEFDAKGTGHLELAESMSEPVFLPLERWGSSQGATAQSVDGDLVLHTPPVAAAYAFTYAPLIVPRDGQYQFRLKGKPKIGSIAFGAFPGDESRWLASDLFGRNTPGGYEMSISVDLKQGDTVILRIANNSGPNPSATFVLESVTVTTRR
jgi:hypothetical protein